MNIGVIILCRYSSSRLEGKALQTIAGRSVLGHVIDRLVKGVDSYPIVVATSTEISDDAIAKFCRYSNVQCYRGSLLDVSERFINCAEAFGFDYAIRINADNIFADPNTLRAMIAIAQTRMFDFVTNVPRRTFPFGMSVEIVDTKFYRDLLHLQDDRHREHVTSWLYENEPVGKRFHFSNDHCLEASGLHLALDTKDDFIRLSDAFARMDKHPASYSIKEIVQLVTSKPLRSPWLGQHGPLLIAEIGGNHEGNFELAKDLTTKAISSGVDFVKFQIYRGNTLVSPVESPDRNLHFKTFELSRRQHLELAQMCKAAGVGYMASVWDLDLIDFIDPFMPIYKIGSGDLTAFPIIRAIAGRGKPIILSTGLATLDEVIQSVAQIQSIDKRYFDPNWLCLLQCTSMYPIPPSAANLQVMDTLRDATGLAVGYSDHTEGIDALRTAAAMGAQVLEFHFTDAREDKTFRDHKVSLTPDEVRRLQQDLDLINLFRGNRSKLPQKIESDEGHLTSFRRGTYLKKSYDVGNQIRKEDLIYLRPNIGVDARDGEGIVGACSQRALVPFQRLEVDKDFK